MFLYKIENRFDEQLKSGDTGIFQNDAGRDSQTFLAGSNSQARTGTKKMLSKIFFLPYAYDVVVSCLCFLFVFFLSFLYPSLATMYGHTFSKSMDQPGKVANPARGQLDRENEYFPVPIRT